MRANTTILLGLALAAMPMTFAHTPAGTPDTTCENTPAEWDDHDYGPPAAGLLLQGFVESNLQSCDGGLPDADYDGHSEYSLGGAWLLVESAWGSGGGSLACFGEEGHHPRFGPIEVRDLVLGSSVAFTVAADTVDGSGLGDACGDFLHDVSVPCFSVCTVSFLPGLDGSYQVYVGGSFNAGSMDDERVGELLMDLLLAGLTQTSGGGGGSQGHVVARCGNQCQANCLLGTCNICCGNKLPDCYCELSQSPKCTCL